MARYRLKEKFSTSVNLLKKLIKMTKIRLHQWWSKVRRQALLEKVWLQLWMEGQRRRQSGSQWRVANHLFAHKKYLMHKIVIRMIVTNKSGLKCNCHDHKSKKPIGNLSHQISKRCVSNNSVKVYLQKVLKLRRRERHLTLTITMFWKCWLFADSRPNSNHSWSSGLILTW